ncbi:MAG: hypothetical protein BWX70_02427 [Verrucomicrobia bacterium ADurb.Bin070]|nr:MAG: hypothetical protein BWX70_02427 [Verrucomicrobia bacterium ADurb.Bin070]
MRPPAPRTRSTGRPARHHHDPHVSGALRHTSGCHPLRCRRRFRRPLDPHAANRRLRRLCGARRLHWRPQEPPAASPPAAPRTPAPHRLHRACHSAPAGAALSLQAPPHQRRDPARHSVPRSPRADHIHQRFQRHAQGRQPHPRFSEGPVRRALPGVGLPRRRCRYADVPRLRPAQPRCRNHLRRSFYGLRPRGRRQPSDPVRADPARRCHCGHRIPAFH